MAAEGMNGAVVQVPGKDPFAGAVVAHDQVNGEIFDVKFGLMLQGLLIKCVQHSVTGTVGGSAGALHRGFAEIPHMAAEGALVNFAFVIARKRHAEMFKFYDRWYRFTAHIFNGVLVTQPVGALDGVVHMPFPMILGHVAK